MTMPKAVALLMLSLALTVVGVVLVVMRVNSGIVNPAIEARSNTGAFTGEQAATPIGFEGLSRGAADATVAASIRDITATAGTAAAVLTPFPTGSTGRGNAVAIGEPILVGNSRFTVHQVQDPEAPGFFPTNPGNRRIGIEVSQEAVSGAVQYNFSQFRLRDATGKIHSWTTVNGTPGFGGGTLQPGETRRGWISFQVPQGVAIDALILQLLGQASAVPIVDLR